MLSMRPEREPSQAEAAYRLHYRRIFAFFLKRTRNLHDAEDLTQRVFADAVAAFSRDGSEPRSMLDWLYTVAERRMADEMRSRTRVGPPTAIPTTEVVDYGYELSVVLRGALDQLPDEQRTVIVLRLLRGLSFAQIASELGSSEAACKMRFSRGLRHVRDELASQGRDPTDGSRE